MAKPNVVEILSRVMAKRAGNKTSAPVKESRRDPPPLPQQIAEGDDEDEQRERETREGSTGEDDDSLGHAIKKQADCNYVKGEEEPVKLAGLSQPSLTQARNFPVSVTSKRSGTTRNMSLGEYADSTGQNLTTAHGNLTGPGGAHETEQHTIKPFKRPAPAAPQVPNPSPGRDPAGLVEPQLSGKPAEVRGTTTGVPKHVQQREEIRRQTRVKDALANKPSSPYHETQDVTTKGKPALLPNKDVERTPAEARRQHYEAFPDEAPTPRSTQVAGLFDAPTVAAGGPQRKKG